MITARYVTCHHQQVLIRDDRGMTITNILLLFRLHQPLTTMCDEVFFEKQFTQINGSFEYACRQVVLINSELEALRVRYERAEKNRERAFLYSQRLRLIVLEGTRAMFYEYATACSDRLASLHEEMILSDNSVEQPETSGSSSLL